MAEPISTSLVIGSIAASAAGAFAQMANARAATEAEYQAQQQNLKLQYEEADRQAAEARSASQGDVSERVRRGNIEMSAVRSAALERGLSGASMTTLLASTAYTEGVDISRIHKNTDARMDALDARRRAGHVEFGNRVTSAHRDAQANMRGAALDFAGTALSIGGSAWSQKLSLDAMKNKVPTGNGP